MRISLLDFLAVGNAGAVANAGREATRRRMQDETIDRLVAALSRHDAAISSERSSASAS